MSPIAGKIFDKIGARPLAIIGMAILTVMTFLFTQMTASTSYMYMMVIYTIRMFGMALVMMPVMTVGLNQLPDLLISHGTAMSNTLRQVAGSIGTAVLITVMTNSTKSAGQQKLLDPMIHGTSDAFMVATILAFVAVILSFFIKSKKKTEENKAGAKTPVTEGQ